MGQLIRLNTAHALTHRLRQEVAQRQHRLDQIQKVTTLAIRESAQLQQTVAHVVVATLSLAHQEINAARQAGRVTPHQEQALYHYREAYKHELLNIVSTAHHKVYRLVDSLK